jgi:hypothetical protein
MSWMCHVCDEYRRDSNEIDCTLSLGDFKLELCESCAENLHELLCGFLKRILAK